ncbi:hypothetical protein [Streptomyces sp. NRRL WC-3742]|uniref:hypothetical protein n=1 Tax=Streptomyces sp. NRRL WC-3742 TaxID=1463934 RepID=UPI00131D3D3C|nr:hypothetical protein [Streptomyces sp. NRRL WC-3742]
MTTVALASLSACSGGPPPPVPLPSEVPSSSAYGTASELVAALGRGGIPCSVTLSNNRQNGSSDADCTAVVDGVSFENEISAFGPSVTLDEIGTSVDHRRGEGQTLVAAGRWYVYVRNPAYAPQVAKALDGVVLPGKELAVPSYSLPAIPASPRFATVQQLADALDGAAGCTDRKDTGGGRLTCTTGAKLGRTPNCATLQLHPDDAARDKALRIEISHPGVPASLVTAANWTVNLCDYALADQVARAMGGVVVAYDGR